MTNEVGIKPSSSSKEGLKTDMSAADINDVAFSFSSISTKSSSSEPPQDLNAPVDMRNDEAQTCNSMNDELRAAESSYDEAATEAVNLHYSGTSYLQNSPRYRRNEGLRDMNSQRRES